MYKILQVLRRLIDAAKFRSRATKDDPIELRSPVTKDDIIAEVWFLFYMFYMFGVSSMHPCQLIVDGHMYSFPLSYYIQNHFLLPQLTCHSSSLPPILF
jgi:hypothetical protein